MALNSILANPAQLRGLFCVKAEREMNDWERTLAWLAGMGALTAVGRALTSKEKLSWKVAVGRTILGSALSTAAALIYIPFPNAPQVVMIGAGAAVGILGEQVLEFAARRLLDFKFGGIRNESIPTFST